MKSVLFICLGNICRSPAAEGIFSKLLEDQKLKDLIRCDSAGLLDYHKGARADSRMIEHAQKRGFNLTSISRPFDPEADFLAHDYIIVMDNSNFQGINELDHDNSYQDKVFKMTDFCTKLNHQEVPDPYYGGGKGFDLVLDILEDACEGLLEKIKQEM